MAHRRSLALATMGAALLLVDAGAVTRVRSADGQDWDVQDTSPWAQGSGGIATLGRAYSKRPGRGRAEVTTERLRRASSSCSTSITK